tara:strand:+ start:455 stop:739 length:285 start_codon:yes stop_codon:yes gene_type:complete
MGDTRFEIIAWDGCPWCSKAYDLLREGGHEVSMVLLGRDSQQLSEAKALRQWKTVPMITQYTIPEGVDAEEELFIGGYTDLCSHLSAKGEKEVG